MTKGAPVENGVFVASSLHIPNGGAGRFDDDKEITLPDGSTTTKAIKKSKKGLDEQAESYADIVQKARVLAQNANTDGENAVIYLSGDHNERTCVVKNDMAPQVFHDALNDGKLVFRAKYLKEPGMTEFLLWRKARGINFMYNDGVPKEEAAYRLSEIATDLNAGLRSGAAQEDWDKAEEVRARMHWGGSLKYHMFKFQSQYGLCTHEEQIGFSPPYKKSSDGLYEGEDTPSVPAFTDRHVLVCEDEKSLSHAQLSGYDKTKMVHWANPSDHDPVELTAVYPHRFTARRLHLDLH